MVVFSFHYFPVNLHIYQARKVKLSSQWYWNQQADYIHVYNSYMALQHRRYTPFANYLKVAFI